MDKDDSDDDDGFIAKEEEPQPLHNEPDDVSKYVKSGRAGIAHSVESLSGLAL